MKNLNLLLSVLLFISMFSCSEPTDPEAVNVTESVEEQNTEAEQNPEGEEIPEKEKDLTTIESFWNVFKNAVAEKDMKTLESLYAPETNKNKFGSKEYQDEIAASNSEDIIATDRLYNDEKVFEFQMIFPPEEDAEDFIEASQTSIFFIKKIFNPGNGSMLRDCFQVPFPTSNHGGPRQ